MDECCSSVWKTFKTIIHAAYKYYYYSAITDKSHFKLEKAKDIIVSKDSQHGNIIAQSHKY